MPLTEGMNPPPPAKKNPQVCIHERIKLRTRKLVEVILLINVGAKNSRLIYLILNICTCVKLIVLSAQKTVIFIQSSNIKINYLKNDEGVADY